jgi:hypothetical protein
VGRDKNHEENRVALEIIVRARYKAEMEGT